MRDPEAVRRMVAQVEHHYGRIDVLINNAAQRLLVPIEQANIEQYRSIFELNVVGVLVAMQAVIPVMRKLGGGVMVNISSGVTKFVRPGIGPYASTKHALNSLTLTAPGACRRQYSRWSGLSRTHGNHFFLQPYPWSVTKLERRRHRTRRDTHRDA